MTPLRTTLRAARSPRVVFTAALGLLILLLASAIPNCTFEQDVHYLLDTQMPPGTDADQLASLILHKARELHRTLIALSVEIHASRGGDTHPVLVHAEIHWLGLFRINVDKKGVCSGCVSSRYQADWPALPDAP